MDWTKRIEGVDEHGKVYPAEYVGILGDYEGTYAHVVKLKDMIGRCAVDGTGWGPVDGLGLTIRNVVDETPEPAAYTAATVPTGCLRVRRKGTLFPQWPVSAITENGLEFSHPDGGATYYKLSVEYDISADGGETWREARP